MGEKKNLPLESGWEWKTSAQLINKIAREWRGGSLVKSRYCFHSGPEFHSQYFCWLLTPPETPAPEDQSSLASMDRTPALMCTTLHTQLKYILRKKSKLPAIQWLLSWRYLKRGCFNTTVLVSFLLLWKAPRPTANLGGKGLFHLPVVVYHEGRWEADTQGRNLEAGMEAEGHGGTLPSDLLPMAYSIQDHLHRGGTTHNWLCPSTSSIDQENAPTDFPTCNSYGDIFSMSLACVNILCLFRATLCVVATSVLTFPSHP